MWECKGHLLSRPPWSRFHLDRVLLDYDGPRLLLRRTEAGQLYLAWWSDTEDNTERWIYLPLSLSRLYTILSAGLPTREALQSPEDGYLLVVDEDVEQDKILQIYMTDTESIPSESLPLSGGRLNLEIPDDIAAVPTRDRAHVIDLALEPTTYEVGRVGSRVLGQFLGNLQRLVDALGQAAKGDPTSRGSIPAEIIRETQLDVVSSYTGSFGVRLETRSQDDLLGESLGRTAINSLFELMEAGSELDKLTNQLQRLRGRVAKNYEDLLATIETATSSATLRWAQGWQPSYRQVSITRQRAREIRIQVQDAKTSFEDNFSVTGRLVMGSLRALRFEIVDTQSETPISGRIGEGAETQIQSVNLGALCEAILSPEIEVSTATGEEQSRYTLVSIEALPDQPEIHSVRSLPP